jgi:signal transduction histidine kinase
MNLKRRHPIDVVRIRAAKRALPTDADELGAVQNGNVRWLTRDEDEAGPEPIGWERWLSRTGPEPRPGRREWLFDLILAFCLVAVLLRPTQSYAYAVGPEQSAWIGRGGMLVIALWAFIAAVIRRRLPLLSMLLMVTVLAVVPTPLTMVAVVAVIAAYSAVIYSPYHHLALFALPLMALELLTRGYLRLLPGDKLLGILLTAPIVIGFAFYGKETRVQATADVATQRRSREELHAEEIRQAVEGERSRIARELHDVVTHNVSVMVVMAGAARKTLDRSPEQATQALLEVEAAGRSAMAELRQVMGLLTHSAQEQHQLAPQPGLDQVGSLVSRIRATGVPIDYRVCGAPRVLPAGLDLTAYRVVQEALTNTVKHASGASVDILVDYQPAQLSLDIADTGGLPGQTASSGNGRGLIGLRERVSVHGGSVEAGPRPRGGYRVQVQIPLPVEDVV